MPSGTPASEGPGRQVPDESGSPTALPESALECLQTVANGRKNAEAGYHDTIHNSSPCARLRANPNFDPATGRGLTGSRRSSDRSAGGNPAWLNARTRSMKVFRQIEDATDAL